MRCAVYARISRDESDQKIGVDRQLVRGRELADKHGWTVTETYTDNDASAYNGDAREGFDKLRAAIEANAIDAVIVQHQDRIARNTDTFREFGRLCASRDVRIESWSGPIDTASATGRYHSTIQAATDEHYSDLISEKSRAGHDDLAKRGEPNGGRRPFGYQRNDENGDAIRNSDGHRTFTPDETESPIVVEMFERFVSGASIRSLAMDLNDREIYTTGGSRWTTRGVRDVLRNPIYAGVRVHKGSEMPGNWSALIDRRTFEKAQAILSSNDKPAGHGIRKYYLTGGIAKCGVCGTSLVARPQRGKRRYGCPPDVEGSCGGIGIQAVELEALVGELIVGIYESPEIRAFIDKYRTRDQGDDDVLAELDAIKDRRNELAEAFAVGEIDREMLSAGTAKLDTRREELRNLLTTDSDVSDLSIEDIRRAWPAVPVIGKAKMASVVVSSVTINPAVPGRSKFDPGRVEIMVRGPQV